MENGMKRTTRAEVSAEMASRYLVVAMLDDSFGGGSRGGYDSDRLRFAVNLMKRCCTGLKFQGTVAVQASRGNGRAQVLVSTDDPADFLRLGSITGSKPVPAAPWKAQSQFSLDEDTHHQLLEVAGEPDCRGAGRRERERQAAELEDRSLRWKVWDPVRRE